MILDVALVKFEALYHGIVGTKTQKMVVYTPAKDPNIGFVVYFIAEETWAQYPNDAGR